MEILTFKKRSQLPIISIEKYLDKEAKSSEKHEYYNGKIRKMPGSSYNHNQITVQIASAILMNWTLKKGHLGC